MKKTILILFCLTISTKIWGIGNFADRLNFNSIVVNVFEYEDSFSYVSQGIIPRIITQENSPLLCVGIGYERFFTQIFGMGVSSQHCLKSIKKDALSSQYNQGLQNINSFYLDFILSVNLRSTGINGPFAKRSAELGVFGSGGFLIGVLKAGAAQKPTLTPGFGGKLGCFFDFGSKTIGIRTSFFIKLRRFILPDASSNQTIVFFDKKDAAFTNQTLGLSVALRFGF